jgi:hypothetical protein
MKFKRNPDEPRCTACQVDLSDLQIIADFVNLAPRLRTRQTPRAGSVGRGRCGGCGAMPILDARYRRGRCTPLIIKGLCIERTEWCNGIRGAAEAGRGHDLL